MIVGRSAERSRLNRLVADAKDGRSRSLVLRGEAGIGKTVLLDYAASVAGGMRVRRVVGIESEAEIPFAALQLLFAADLDRLDALPGPQAGALRAAFGTSSTSVERLQVGAATLPLLSELAGDRPPAQVPHLGPVQLVEALGGFEQIGAGGWRPRVRAELVALGDPVPDPSAGGSSSLSSTCE